MYNKEIITITDMKYDCGCDYFYVAKELTPIMYLIVSAKCDDIKVFREYVFSHKDQLNKQVCDLVP